MKRISLYQYPAVAIRLFWALFILWVSRFVFFGVNVQHFQGIDAQGWASILWGGLRFDIAAVCYLNSLYVLLQVLPFHARYHPMYQKFSTILFGITNGFGLLANCVDTFYFSFTLRRTTSSVLKEFSNEDHLSQILLTSASHYWYFIPIFLALFFLLMLGYHRIVIQPSTAIRPAKFYSLSLGMLVLFPVLFVGGIRGDWRYSTRPITMSNAGQYVKRPAEIPLVLNTPFCILRTIQQEFYKEDSFFEEPQLSSIYSPLVSFDSISKTRTDNVVILVLESFGRESLGFYNKSLAGGTYKGYTPFLDSLLEHSLVYEYGFATGRKSIDALPAVLTGIPSGELPFVLTPYASNEMHSLPYLLGKKGYHTSFFHGAPNGSMGFQAFTNLIGVQHYFGKDEYGNDADFDGTWGIWDEPFLQFFARKLDSFPEPFQSTLFSVSSHEPFVVPAAYKGKFPKGHHPIREVTGYTDYALRKFFARIRNKPWFKRTLFVITADHASLTYDPTYQTAWGNMAIPIFFYHPSDSLQSFQKGRIIQQTDIMPSVLGFLGHREPVFGFGKNVFAKSVENWAVNYYGGFQIFQGDYLLQLNNATAAALYNFKTDPLLKNNLLGTAPGKVKAMEQFLKAFIQQYHNRLIQNRLLPPAP